MTSKVAVVCALVLACDATVRFTPSAKDMESKILSTFEAKTGFAVASVECPGTVVAKKSMCKVNTVAGEEIDVEVSIDGMIYNWEAPSVRLGAEYETDISTRFEKKYGVVFTVQCPKATIKKPGATFICTTSCRVSTPRLLSRSTTTATCSPRAY